MSNKRSFLVPMSSPDLTDAERQAVLEVISTPHLSMGPRIGEFEEAFRRYSGCKHAIAISSGTAGLHLCLRAAGVGPGDMVITTPFSFVASANAILYEQAIPVFVDVDVQTGNMDPDLVQQAAHDLSKGGVDAHRWLPRDGLSAEGRLKAILAVDVFGQPAEYDRLRQTAQEHDLILIEDSCEALGGEYKGRKAGTLGEYGIYAFYPNKQITTGEGGMIVTDNDRAAAFMSALRNQGRAPGDTWLQHTYLGYNYRLDEMSSALGVVQMARLEELLGKRQQVADWYGKHLDGIKGVEIPYLAPTTTRVSWFVYVIRLARGIPRQLVAQRLEEMGIPVRPYFLPIHLQPYMADRFDYRTGDYPVTEDLGERGLALPFSGRMSEKDVSLVCQSLKKTVQGI